MKPILTVLISLIPVLARGQTVLKAGTFHHLKPTRPLVLDTGRFTFGRLEGNLSPAQKGKTSGMEAYGLSDCKEGGEPLRQHYEQELFPHLFTPNK